MTMKRSVCGNCGRKIIWTQRAFQIDLGPRWEEEEPENDSGWRHMGLKDNGFQILMAGAKPTAVYCGGFYPEGSEDEDGYMVAEPPRDPLARICASLDEPVVS